MGEFSLHEALAALTAQSAAFAALLLLASAAHKATNWSQQRGVMRQFGAVPAPLAASALAAVVLGEVTTGILLLVPPARAVGALLAAGLWTAYLLLILRAILRGRREVDCGCSFGTTSHPLGAFQMLRNTMLIGVALFTAAGSAVADPSRVQGSQALAACALLALYAALDQVMALQPLRSGELS